MTDEELKKKAYIDAMRLRNSGLDDEVIYARLEKQGIPPELIIRVLQNMSLQIKKETVIREKESNELKSNSALIKAGGGVLLAIVTYFLFDGNMVIPTGCILGGVGLALFYKTKS